MSLPTFQQLTQKLGRHYLTDEEYSKTAEAEKHCRDGIYHERKKIWLEGINEYQKKRLKRVRYKKKKFTTGV